VIGSDGSIWRASSSSERAASSERPAAVAWRIRAEQRGERGRIGLGGRGEPARRRAGVVVVGGEHAARRLQRRAQLVVADRLGELLERDAELVGAAVEERELELGEQRADVGRPPGRGSRRRRPARGPGSLLAIIRSTR